MKKNECTIDTNRDEILNNNIFVIAQQFHGNRTGTRINPQNVDYFIRGYLDNYNPKMIEDVDRKVVCIPGSNNIVIVYDQAAETNYVNIEFPKFHAEHAEDYRKNTGKKLCKHISCKIPEIGFEIHTRCIVCRIDEHGHFISLKPGDAETFIDYLPVA